MRTLLAARIWRAASASQSRIRGKDHREGADVPHSEVTDRWIA